LAVGKPILSKADKVSGFTDFWAIKAYSKANGMVNSKAMTVGRAGQTYV
jgi:hypothetical protein